MRLILVIALILSLAACADRSQPLKVTSAALNLPRPSLIVSLPPPAPIEILPFEWVVIMDASGTPYFALSSRDFQNLARTNGDTLRWVREAGAQLDYYQKRASVGAFPASKEVR